MNNNQVKMRQKNLVEPERITRAKALCQEEIQKIRGSRTKNDGNLNVIWKRGKNFQGLQNTAISNFILKALVNH